MKVWVVMKNDFPKTEAVATEYCKEKKWKEENSGIFWRSFEFELGD